LKKEVYNRLQRKRENYYLQSRIEKDLLWRSLLIVNGCPLQMSRNNNININNICLAS